jgi:hypothetical protein
MQKQIVQACLRINRSKSFNQGLKKSCARIIAKRLQQINNLGPKSFLF